MILPVTQRPQARLDLLEQFVYFGDQASVELAERYFAAVDATRNRAVERPSPDSGQRIRELPALLLAAPERNRRNPCLARGSRYRQSLCARWSLSNS
jgi:hypothetical protein